MTNYDINLLRKKEIEETLLTLMQEIPYDRISVKSLTDRISIARKTFYHYYSSKQTCLESLIDRLILDCNLQLMALPESTGMEDIYQAHLRFWMQQQPFLQVILSNKLSDLLVDRIFFCIQKEDFSFRTRLNTKKLPCDEDILYYYVSGQVCLLLRWCRDGFSGSVEEMVKKNLRLVYEPLLTRYTRS